MDEQEQQSVEIARQAKPSSKTKWYIVIGVTLALVLIIVVVENFIPQSATLSVSSIEKSCSDNAECVLVNLDCCKNCNVDAVNIKYKAKYDSFFDSTCKNKSYPELMKEFGCVPTTIPCLPMKPACENNLCVAERIFYD